MNIFGFSHDYMATLIRKHYALKNWYKLEKITIHIIYEDVTAEKS